MLYALPAVVPFFAVFALLALAGSIVSVTMLTQSLVRHHRTRVTRHQTIPTYYRRLVLAH
jgi:hypothetical protein